MIGKLVFLTTLALAHARPSENGAALLNTQIHEPHEMCPSHTHYLLPHEYDCTKFYYCEYGLKFIEPRDCAPGTEFSYEMQVCTHPVLARCNLPGYPPTETSTEPPTEPSTTLSTEPSTQPPTTLSTESSTQPSTTLSTEPSTQPPTTLSTDPSTQPPTTLSTEPSTQPPTTLSTEPSTQSPSTEASTESPTTLSTEPSTQPPTTPSTEPSTQPPTTLSTEPSTEPSTTPSTEPTTLPPTESSTPSPTTVTEAPVQTTPTASITVPDSTSTSAPSESPSETLPNGCPADFHVHQLLPHESECNKFYYCNFGEKVERECAPGTYFNPQIQVCDWPQNVNCSSDNGVTGTEPPTISTEAPIKPTDSTTTISSQSPQETLPNGCPSDWDVHQLLPHETDCDKFYYCVHGQKVESECAPGTHFNPKLQVCDWPQNAGCANVELAPTTTQAPTVSTSQTTPEATTEPSTTTTEAPTVPPTQTIPEPTTEPPTTTTQASTNPSTTEATTVPPIETTPSGNKCEDSCNVLPWPHETDCDKYWLCDGQTPVLVQCSLGLHFNPNSLTCDYICTAGCMAINSTQNVHPLSALKP